MRKSYKSDYEIAKQRQEGIEKDLAQAVAQSQVTNRSKVALNELESDAQSYRTLYDNFLQRYIGIGSAAVVSDHRGADSHAGCSAARETSRGTSLVLLITATSGIILGLGIGRLRDLSDRVFRTRAQVEASLALDCLAIVPYIKLDKRKGDASHPKKKDDYFFAGSPKSTDHTGKLKSLGRGTVGQIIRSTGHRARR